MNGVKRTMIDKQRHDSRDFFYQTFAKMQQPAELNHLELMTSEIIKMHPEYHQFLKQPNLFHNKDFHTSDHLLNPFLHMGLHLTLKEFMILNQPEGIGNIYRQFCIIHSDQHEAEHAMIDCIQVIIHEAQYHKKPLEQEKLMTLLHEKIEKSA